MKQKFKWLLALVAMVASVNLMWGATYTKVTSVTDGVYLIVNEASSRVFNGLDAASDYVECTISNGTITSDDLSACEVTIAAMTGGYSILINNGDKAGSYIYGKSGSNSIQYGATAVASTISVTDGAAKIENNSTYFCYNSQSGNDRFRFYKNTTTGATYIVPALYKKENGDEPDPDKPSLSVSPKTIDFGIVYQKEDVDAQQVTVTFSNLTADDVEANTDDLSVFDIDKYGSFTSGDKITITPNTYYIGNYEETLILFSETDDLEEMVTITMNVVEAPAPFEGKKLTFDFVTHPSGWPTAKGDAVEGNLTYTLNSTDYVFLASKSGDGIYMGGTSGSSGYLMVAKSNNLGLPAISGYKLVKVEGTLNGSGSPSTKSEISITDGTNVIAGGASQTWDTKGGVKTYSLTETEENTMYYLSVSSTANCQIITLTLYYEELAPTSSAVIFAAPEGGSLVIKNGATPITTGATIQNGTVLDVAFGMTPAEAYKDVAIKVTKTEGGDDVTSTVYDATTQKITMPRYAITVAVTSTKLYKISLVTAGDGTGSATMNGVTTDIYVDDETQINLVANAVAPNEFTSWSATDNIEINEVNKAETYAYASGDGTITATFGISELQPLDAPTLSDPTNVTYSGVTLNWQDLANAEGYNVEILLNDETVASDFFIGETSWTPEVTLQANTTYTYTVQGVGDGSTYAEENNPKAQSTFTTADYPAATLTLSENGETRDIVGKLNTPINLPTTSTQACDGKVFVGWSATTIDGEVDAATLLGATYTFTNPEQLTATIYAVYAKEILGEAANWEITSLDKLESGSGYAPYNGSHTTDNISYTTSQIMMSSDNTIQFQKNAGYMYNTTPFSGDILFITIADITSDISVYEGSTEIATTPTSGAITLTDGKYTFSKGKKYFHIKMGNATGYSSKITVAVAGASSYEKYCTTCVAAIVPPTFSPDGGSFDHEQSIELTAAEGAIYYTINGGTETLYEEAIELDERGTYEISAYAKVDDRTSEIVTKTYTLNWAYTLAELVAEGAPTSTGRTVTVILTNEVIESFATSGSYVNGFFTMVGDKKIEVYCYNSPATWEVGGKVSGTVTCPWKDYQGTWELCPTDWNWASYTAPAKITSLVITGDVTNKEYTAGQKLDFTGLTVTGVYEDNTEQVSHKEDVTADVVWTEVTLTENQPTATATATLNSVKTGNVAVNASKTIEGLTVGAKVELSKIEITTEATKKDFFVGRNFNHDGIVVTATYSNGTTSNVTNACQFSTPSLTEAGEETITITYSEGEGADKVEKTTSYEITVTYMNLSDLVAEDVPTNTIVKVAFSDVEITGFYTNSSDKRAGVYVNVKGKNEKDIELYSGGTPSETLNGWQEGGKLASKGDYITGTWKYYDGGSVWEIDFGSAYAWSTNIEYTAPNIPVTSMEISPAEVSVGEAKTTTLSIVYTPEHATNTGVTWAVTAGSEFASIDAETGEVTGIAVGTATITATLTADPSITATCTVTVTETPKCEISYNVRGSVASTQTIAREEEGTLTYEPTLTVAGYTFAGWAEAAIAEESATATLISTYTPGAEEATKAVYAIFKRVDDSSPTYQQYAKVTSALTDWAGDYLLVYENEGTAYVWTGVDAASCYATATIDGNVISSKPDGASSLTIAAMTDGYSILVNGGDNNGKYIGKNASGNGMDIGASAYKNTISISENSAVIAGAGGSTMRYNSASDQLRFRYYGSGQKAVQLYKYDAGSVMYTSNPVAKVKVTFNLDGGVGGCGTITVNEGEDAVLCEEAPTKDLNKFKAWSDGENEYAPSATIENVTEDIELKALWIAKQQYTITFNKGGAAGTTPASIKDYEYNEVALPAQGDLSNPGYIFGGWNDGEITYAGGATFTMPEKNVTMTAVWVARTNDKWVLVTSADQLVAGKKYVIANNENDAVAGDITGTNKYMNKLNATFSDNKQFITAMAGQVELTLGGSTDAWTFAKDASNYLANSGTDLSWSTTASTWKIAFEDGKMTIVEGTNNSLQYNTSSPRFKTYTSAQAAVQLYVLIPAQVIDEEVNASTLDNHADVTVNEGGNLLVTEGDIELGDIYVMEGGTVTISGTATLTVNNFVIKSSMGGGQSGQVLGVTSTNFTITGSAYFDVVLGDNGNPDKWHAFAVPFNVDAINDIYDLDDNKLTNEVNYAIMDYHGDVRATGAYGWKKFRGIMQPGVFYLMTVDGERTTYRMKMNGGFTASSTTITVNQYASGTDTDAGWNGIANNQLGYSSLGVDVQVLNPTSYTYEVMTASTYNFTVGTPFFYQASETGSIDLTAPNAGANYAPRMEAEAKNIAVTLGNDNYTDRLYISATDEATNEYQIGRDLVKMTMTNAPTVPQIFAEAYGTKLCMVDAPMMYDEAVYALNLYAPANGEYTMTAAQVEGYEVFLTQYGNVIWNLSMSEATVELTKGNNAGYGLILKATSGHAPTDINTINGQESVQKFLYNSNIYIRHDNKTFDVQGQLVK